MCLPSVALLQHLPSYLGFSYLGHGVFLHGCSSKAQALLLTLDEGYLLTAALPDLQCQIAPLGPPAPAQPLLLGLGVASPSCHPWPRSLVAPPNHCPDLGRRVASWLPDFGRGVAPPSHRLCPWTWSSSSLPFLRHRSLALSAAAPDLEHGVAPLGHA